MSNYTITKTLKQPYTEVVEAVRTALEDEGFGVLTEIDLQAKLKEKLGVDIEPEIILGACRPPLALEAIQADPSIAAVLPCNVVIRSVDKNTTVVDAFDPDAMMGLADNATLHRIAADAKQRLNAVLATLNGEN